MNEYDAAIIGGGPSGSTVGTLLKKYKPELKVLILEREKFPRDHVGESLLPIVSTVLHEMGCWDQVEAANFPVKVGATYRWGSSDDLWDFDFLGGQPYQDALRPAKYEGQRTRTAFQVDRAVYDQILLSHAGSLGVDVREDSKVVEVLCDQGSVNGLKLADGNVITANHYVDASGHTGVLRRALGIEVQEPSKLRNIAIWSYWQNADWAVNIGVSGTRIQIMSLGWGWIWFIPLGPTRTSIGLVLPADYYKESGKRPEELYIAALEKDPQIHSLLRNAVREEGVHSTKDWSFVASEMTGPNWFLLGEAAGFADPILSAGLTIAQVGAWEAAITIVESERGEHESDWLKSEFERQQTRRIRTHIQFADYWYSANTHFTDLVEYVSVIAKDAGISLDGKNAWQWLGTGGFVDTDMGGAGVGGFSLLSAAWLVGNFNESPADWSISKNNRFTLSLEGAQQTWIAAYRPGWIERIPALVRANRALPTTDICHFLLDTLSHMDRIDQIIQRTNEVWSKLPGMPAGQLPRVLETLEAMVTDGWVKAEYVPGYPLVDMGCFSLSNQFHKNVDNKLGGG